MFHVFFVRCVYGRVSARRWFRWWWVRHTSKQSSRVLQQSYPTPVSPNRSIFHQFAPLFSLRITGLHGPVGTSGRKDIYYRLNCSAACTYAASATQISPNLFVFLLTLSFGSTITMIFLTEIIPTRKKFKTVLLTIND